MNNGTATYVDDAREELQKALNNALAQQHGYRSWGSVKVDRIHMRQGQGVTYDVDDSGTLIKADEVPKTALKLFRKRRGVHIILETSQQYGSRITEHIPPILDDQAQLLGPSLRYVPLDRANDPSAVHRALKGRYAVNLGDGRTICIGKNLEEAYVAAQLVEKTSKAFLGAKALGGARSINRLEAWAMHKFYMLKYSKESERNK